MNASSSPRMPVVFLPHGGGPWPWMDGVKDAYRDMASYMRALAEIPPQRPEAILCISAHWEAPVPTVMSSPSPPMLYDYYGFPPETYEVKWPAPGATDLAGEIDSLVSAAGFSTKRDPDRGFDHGTFVPLALGYPKADVPTLQLSLLGSLDPAEHIRLGRALAPLRDRGVFIVGSGMSYHNMRGFGSAMRGAPGPVQDSKAFDDWLAESMTAEAGKREAALVEWEKAPAARECHPREEHLLPLHVCAGAAEDDAATLPYRGLVLGTHVSAVHFG